MTIDFAPRRRALIMFGLVAVLGASAHAADADAGPVAAGDPVVLEAAQVKATREGGEKSGYKASQSVTPGPLGSQPLLDTPSSVTVISSDMIANMQASGLEDVVKYASSAQIEYRGGAEMGRPQTRGLQGSVVQNSRLDGFNVVSTTAYPMEQLDRVEILNGLEGAMYGPANPAGLFSYILKRPTETSLHRVTLTHLDDSYLEASADLSDRVGENRWLGYRLNVIDGSGEGYAEGSKLRRKLLSGSFDVHASSHTVLEFNYSYYDYYRMGYPGSFTFKTTVPIPEAPDPTRVTGQTGGVEGRTTTKSVRIKHDFNGNWNFVGGILQQVAVRIQGNPSNTFNTDGSYTTKISSFSEGEFDITSNMAYLSGHEELWGIGHELTLGTSGFTWNGVKQQGGSLTDTLHFSPRWSARLSGSEDNIQVYSTSTGAVTWSGTGFSGSASLMFKPVARMMLYATLSNSLEQGEAVTSATYNSVTVSNYGQVLEPYRCKQVEVGTKGSVGGLNLSIALFQIERPFAMYVPTGSTYTYEIQGEQRNRGVELGANGRLAERLTLNAGFTYLDPIMTKAYTAGQGNLLPGAPKYQSNVLVEYQVPGVQDLATSLNWHYTGSKAVNDANTLWTAAYSTFDVGARYGTRLWSVPTKFRLSVNNALDKHYWASIFANTQTGTGTTGSGFLGTPREIKLSMSMDL
nr:TonB-dependent receptor [uncultured Holophaga sp.]